MDGSQPDEVEIFNTARGIETTESRRAYVRQACGDDLGLRARIEALLRVHDEDPGFLESPVEAGWPPASSVASGGEGPGSRIGQYKLIEQIGEGGFGSVYLAEQQQPLRRTVALKILKAGMDTRQVVARFEAERQALALMDHPHIARVLDGGETASGRPFFVMELVKGVAITRYCDERQLTPRERLALFVPVCEAVQHAHQKGIIHRDLKPSNILVAAYDGRAVPKVIDFGVAKALGQPLTDRTLVTGFHSVVGTLEYMSPEQAEFNAADIDTRADIYSLGVLLYELLTGTTPLTKEQLTHAALTEALRMIREVDPPRPSLRLSESRDTLASISAQRRLEPARLNKELRGELDWIVMKAIDKDRGRRYETANGLARDIQRYLHDEPVEARAQSKTYQLSKFLRRHKGAVLAVAAVMLALIAGIVGTSLGLVRADRARQEAEKAREAQTEERLRAEANERKAVAAAAAERQAKETAQTREAETRAVLGFVENKIFSAARPERQEGGLGPRVSLREAIEAALPFVDQGFGKQPLIEARLRMSLGTSFYFLGESKIAAAQFEKARTLYTSHLGVDHRDTLRSMDNLANAYEDLGRTAEAVVLRDEALARERATLGINSPDTLGAMNNLATSYIALGRYTEALKLLEEALSLSKANQGPGNPETLRFAYNLARVFDHLGRHAEALKLNEETLALRKATLGPDHPDTLFSMNNVSANLATLGRHEEALRLQEETLALQKAKLGLEHPGTLSSMHNLALRYAALGRHVEALALFEKVEALHETKLGPGHPHTLMNMYNLACLHSLMIPESTDRMKHADLAMGWLQKAVAAGFREADQLKKDTDFDALRGRPDFKKLISELEAKQPTEKK